MRDSAWRYLGVLVVGILLGAVLLRLIFPPADSGLTVQASSVEQQELYRDLGQRLDRLDDSIRALSESIGSQGNEPARVVREISPGNATEDETETHAPTEHLAERRHPSFANAGWTEHLPRELAEVLVVNGVTPFDPGVNRFLPEAVRQFKEAELVRRKALYDLDTRFEETKNSYKSLTRDVKKQRQAEKLRLSNQIHNRWGEVGWPIIRAFELEVKNLALRKPGK